MSSLEATGYRYEVMKSRPTTTRTFPPNHEIQQVRERIFVENLFDVLCTN